MFDTLGHRLYGDLLVLVDLLGGLQEHLVGRWFDLDDVGAHQGCHVRGIGADIHRGFGFLGHHAAARIGPHNNGKTDRLGFFGQLADLFHQLELVFGTGVNRKADRSAAETQRVVDRRRDGLVFFGCHRIGGIAFQDRRDRAGEAVSAGFEHAERGCKG